MCGGDRHRDAMCGGHQGDRTIVVDRSLFSRLDLGLVLVALGLYTHTNGCCDRGDPAKNRPEDGAEVFRLFRL